ncbi:MAG: NAD-dependent epimerase/dehydratase family protein [Candidatus Thermoplasmatota archaeon]|jgi:NADH dehydrogenase|nr:NAD-dependent epimerase/dehydratase family protein [Candidatus Thermoplasmatota archaeon]MCL5964050.1 NAD-dependent epimerase/dehydratase family protein [Candidatus Thermoplasmatota archaeon]
MKIAIIGGSGFLGSSIIRREKDNHNITCFSRKRNTDIDKIGIDWKMADIRNRDTLTSLKDFDVVINLVGLIKKSDETHREVNITGMKNIIDSVDRNVKIVYLSAMNAEECKTEYYRTKHEAEKMVMQRGNYLILRPSPIYGNKDYFTQTLLKLSNQNIPFLPKTEHLYPIYIADFVTIFNRLLPEQGIFEISGTDEITLAQMVNIIRKMKEKREVKEMSRAFFYPLLPVLSAMGIITLEQFKMLSLDFSKGRDIWKKYSIIPKSFNEVVPALSSMQNTT